MEEISYKIFNSNFSMIIMLSRFSQTYVLRFQEIHLSSVTSLSPYKNLTKRLSPPRDDKVSDVMPILLIIVIIPCYFSLLSSFSSISLVGYRLFFIGYDSRIYLIYLQQDNPLECLLGTKIVQFRL